MAEFENEEEYIKNLLLNMPKMRDQRSPEEIYRNIKYKVEKKQSKKKMLMIPSVIIATFAIIVVLISSSFMQSNPNEIAKSTIEPRKESLENKAVTDQDQQNIEHNSQFSFSEKRDVSPDEGIVSEFSARTIDKKSMSAIYEQDLQQNDMFTYGVFTKDAILVPISVEVSKSDIDWFTNYLQTAEALPLEQWGFASLPNIPGELQYRQNEKKLHITVPKDQVRKVPEYVEQNLTRILQYSFSFLNHIKEVDYSDENGDPIQLNNIGLLKSYKVSQLVNVGYFSYLQTNGMKLLVPSDLEYSSFNSAIENMKKAPNDFYQPIIPNQIHLKATENHDNSLNIEFNKLLDFSQGNEDYQLMLDGILLTAKSFGYKEVLFKDVSPMKWEKFDFSKPIKVPIAPNKYTIKK
ncbi:hypothetical protein AB0Y20_01700 [Heyndrickxia oleronia]|uniref:hypothetical protein n=1 Tax=Heyndrickxia oleronia TaxID=38875 RepID=UPI003F26CFE2